MDDASFWIATLALTLVAGVLIQYALRLRKLRDPTWISLSSVLLLGVIANLAPAYLAMITGDYSGLNRNASFETWTFGLLLDAVFFACFLGGLLFARKRIHRWPERFASFSYGVEQPWILLMIIVGIGVVAFIALGGAWSDWGYERADMYVRSHLSDEAVTLGGPQRLFENLLLLPGCIVFLFGRQTPKRLSGWAATAIVGVVFAWRATAALSSGARGNVLLIALATVSCWMIRGRKMRSLLVLGAVVLALIILSDPIREARIITRSYDRPLAVLERLDIFLRVGSSSSGRDRSLSSMLVHAIARQDDTSSGGVLAYYTRVSGEFVGFKPYVGVLTAAIPRYFWVNKPVPLSMDDSVMGTPWYVVGMLRGEPTVSFGASPAGISYWQFWWVGVVVAGFLNGVLLSVISRAFLWGGPYGLFLYVVYATQIWFVLVGGMDKLLQVLQIMVPFMVLPILWVQLVRMFIHRNEKARQMATA